MSRVSGEPLERIMARRSEILAKVAAIRKSVAAKRPLLARSRWFRVKEELASHAILADVSYDLAARVDARPGYFAPLTVRTARSRVYPMGRLACHVVGRLCRVARGRAPARPRRSGQDPGKVYRLGDECGVSGIEKAYDWELRGSRGVRWMRRRPRPAIDEALRETPARPGDTVVLALDVAAQRRAEESLGASVGAVVVLDVHNGETVVCASSPGFDLNLSGNELARLFSSRPGPFANRAIRDALPPGSVLKILVAIAALEEGKALPGSRVNCTGAYRLGERVFGCRIHGSVDVCDAIRVSCNTYFYHVGRRVGPAGLAAWAARFGLGRLSGVDLPFEKKGVFPDPSWKRRAVGLPWYPGDTINTSIGQGYVQVTPMQVAVMMAAVANGGRVAQPRLVRAILRGNKVASLPHSGRKTPVMREIALNPGFLAKVRKGMRDVVARGDGSAARIAGLSELGAAGKTGTAQTGRAEVNHAWFAGFVPWQAPRYAFAVVIESTPLAGGEAAAPVARDVLRELLASRGGAWDGQPRTLH